MQNAWLIVLFDVGGQLIVDLNNLRKDLCFKILSSILVSTWIFPQAELLVRLIIGMLSKRDYLDPFDSINQRAASSSAYEFASLALIEPLRSATEDRDCSDLVRLDN